MATVQPKKEVQVTVQPRQSEDSYSSSEQRPLKISTARQPRFAEVTGSGADSPVVEPTTYTARQVSMTHYQPQPQVSDVGFGYINNSRDSQVTVEMPSTPRTPGPLKSAMKSPGAAPRNWGENPLSPTFKENPLSPTWKEEKKLEKKEKRTTKQQAKDLKVKARVRLAKIFLRCTNFTCSLIVLSMLTSTFTIFNETRHLPPRNNLPPWAVGTSLWPQITLLVIACISLFLCVIIMIGMCRAKGRKQGRTKKAAKYYTIFSMGFFTFSIVMWGIGAGILQGSKANGGGQDVWGWSCNDNARRQFFYEVKYTVVCNLQNWSLVCALIEILVETLTILIYGIVFYRFYSKRKLIKSMNVRDDARNDLYLAQLRAQSAPNTPGFPLSPREGGYNPMFSPRYAPGQALTTSDEKRSADEYSLAEEGDSDNVRYVTAPSPQQQATQAKPFTLQAPPMRTTPKTQQKPTFDLNRPAGAAAAENPFATANSSANVSRPQTPQTHARAVAIPPPPMSPTASLPPMSPGFQSAPVHTPAAPGEQQYGAVPIPGAYASPVQSPTFAPMQSPGFAPSQQQQYFAPPRR